MDCSIKKQRVFEGNAVVRKKETSVHRRERRLRAEMRTYSHILKAAQAAAVHHSSSSILVHIVAEFLSRTKLSASSAAASSAASAVAAGVATVGFNSGQKDCAYTTAAAAAGRSGSHCATSSCSP